MTKTEFLQTMRQTKARTAPPAPPINPVAAALQRAGIPTDAPYYAGAFRNVEQALASRKPQSVAFWQAYLLSLCGHLERLERENPSGTSCHLPFQWRQSVKKSPLKRGMPKGQGDFSLERRQLHGSIHTVQAVLYALQETERTENEPRETD